MLHNGGKILIGLVLFLALITFPLWYNFAQGKADYVPELQKPTDGPCVMDSVLMRAQHMDVLNNWRDRVVRTGERYYTDDNGRTVEMSLSNTCLRCHEDKEQFCDKCHSFMGVQPYCWDCHIIPKEVGNASR
jgi:hypothetical protein